MFGLLVIFWFSLFAIVYAYAGYPVLLWGISRFESRSNGKESGLDATLPAISMIVSAYNEEKVIGRKLTDTLALDYPPGLLEVIVVSDGSTDRTVEIVREFADKGVVLRHYEGRIGKTACLNRALPMASGEVIVFSDANSAYSKGALKALVHPFQDQTIGFTTGWTRYTAPGDEGATNSLGLYSRLELITKELESRLGSCVGADGAIFAIRKKLFLPLRPSDINDFVIPLSINQQGYRGILQRGAICFEKDAGSTKGEFFRQVRITNRTIRAIMNYRRLLNPFKFGLFSLQLFSHKLSKFLVPFFLVTALFSNLILAANGGIFVLILVAQCIFYVVAALAGLIPDIGLLSRMVEAAKTFVVVNAAIAVAWVKYFQGETYTTWSPTKR